MPHKPKPPPVFVARTHDSLRVNFGVTADGTVYIIEWRIHACAGAEKAPTERTRKMSNQNGHTANKWRKALIDENKR